MKIKRWDVSVLQSKRVIGQQDADFFTSDTNASIQINLIDPLIQPTRATIVAYNQNDESLVEEDVDVVDNLAVLNLFNEERNLIEHKGTWLITVIFVYKGKRYTTREIAFNVTGSIAEGLPGKIEIVENWNQVKAEIDSMREAEIIREDNEVDRARLYNEIQDKLAAGEFKGEPGIRGEDSTVPGPQGEPGPSYHAGDNITIDENNIINSTGGGGGISPEQGDTIKANTHMINSLFGRSTDWSYLFGGADLETMDFTNFQAPGKLYRDNYIPGVLYNTNHMFAGASFGSLPEGDPYDWLLTLPTSSFWRWYAGLNSLMLDVSSSEYMFANASGDILMLPPNSNFGDSISSAKGMFQGTIANGIDVGDYFGNSIVDMSDMFMGSNITEINTSGWHTFEAKDASNMFNGFNGSIVNLDQLSTQHVEDMSGMFAYYQSTTLDLSSFQTNITTTMSGMFLGSNIESLDLRSFSTYNVGNMFGMFRDSKAIIIDVSSFYTQNTDNMGEMFKNSSATVLDLSSFDTSNVFDMDDMFMGCAATIGFARTQADADRFNNTSNKPAGLIFLAPEPVYELATDTDFSGQLDGEFKINDRYEYVEIPHTIKGVDVTSYNEMFQGSNILGVKSTNPNITDTRDMFIGVKSTSLELIDFDVTSLNSVHSMFSYLDVDILDLSGLDMTNINSTNDMFDGASIGIGYGKTQNDVDKFNNSLGKPEGVVFEVK